MSEPLNRRGALGDRVARLERMIEIRRVEEAIQKMFAEGLVKGSTHTCQGQEAVSVAVAAVARPDDVVTCTYRGHGHALALGMTPVQVMGEVLGRTVGSIGGVGGSMHLSDPSIGLLPTFAIVGAGIPVAVGAAIGRRASGADSIGIALFGDGATNIGAFHEALNLASVWDVPVVFVCENNLYGEYSRIDRTTPFEDLYRRGAAYDIPSRAVDGQDADTLVAELSAEFDAARTTPGPRFVEVKTYRFVGHSRSDTAPYRRPGELDEWLQRDPIAILGDRLVDEGALSNDERRALETTVGQRVAEAVEVVMQAPPPDLAAMFAHVTAGS
ncbi:MAG TPA: thiamine pyrophosphate-dependent dehydrogenase E1 component subunit alpha [Acidimicrobiia bacterium]|nr:thiamine pyrophosphate-dependent dehydrogenase E1 component subunit alpha [Acidimicrobiia bacterium]